MKTKLVLLVITSVCLCAVIAQQQRNVEPGQSAAGNPDPQIISRLTEIVNIRERAAKNHEQMRAAGRAPENSVAEIELAEARINLAKEKGQRQEIATELRNLVAIHEKRWKRIGALPTDRVAQDEIDRARVDLLAAQVRLLRAEK
jgi:hypothetical protein